jgi:hypothetical protein
MSLHDIIAGLEHLLERLRHHAAAPVPQPSPVVEPAAPVVPVSAPNPFVAWKAQGKDLLWIQTFGLQHALSDSEWALAVAAGYEKPAAPGPDTGPAVDTSGPTLAFSVVGGGVPIKLDQAKTVTGCPANVIVRVFPVSGDPSAHVNYNVTINSVSYPVTGIAVFDTGSRGIAVAGPEVTVSVDSPGIEFEIQ